MISRELETNLMNIGRILFIICYPNPRYRRRADDISNLLSYIDKEILNEKSGEETTEAIRYIVNQTSVTSVTTTDDLKTDIKANQTEELSGMAEVIERNNIKDLFQNLLQIL